MANRFIQFKKILLMTALSVVAVALFFAGRNHIVNSEQTVISQTKNHIQTISQTLGFHLKDCIFDITQTLKHGADKPEIKELICSNTLNDRGTKEYYSKYPIENNMWDKLATATNELSSLYRLDKNGIIQNTVPFKNNKVGCDYSGKPGVKYVMETHLPYISNAIVSNSGVKSLSICQPVFDTNKEFVGIMRSTVKLGNIDELINSLNIGKNGYACAIDAKGNLLTTPPKKLKDKSLVSVDEFTSLTKFNRSGVFKNVFSGEPGTDVITLNNSNNSKILTAWQPVKVGDKTFTILVNMDYDEVTGPIAAQQRNIFAVATILLITLAVCGKYLYTSHSIKLSLDEKEAAAKELEKKNKQLAEEISYRQHAQRELEYNERRLRTILNTVQTGIVIVDCQAHEILEVNSAAAKIIGTDKEDILGNTCHKYICPSEKGFCPVADKGQVIHDSEQILINSKGVEVPIQKTVTAVKLGGRNCLLESFSDITAQKQVKQELEKAKELAEASVKMKSQFLANMSHEIRTPMNAIIGFSSLLAEEELSETQKNYTDLICTSSNNLLMIVNDILDFSKIEAGKLEIEHANCYLHNLLDEIKSLMSPLAADKNLSYDVNISDDLPRIISTDAGRLKQCLINLVNNALKFTRQGHVNINVKPLNTGAKTLICFDVEDTGVGIPRSRQDAIFASFTQADGSTCREFGGTGLGLTITKQLSHLLGGDLSLCSTEGEGSTFTLRIPANLEAVSESKTEENPEQGCAMEPQRPFKILVAEDSRANQTLITILLEKQGIEVVIANDGKEAVEKVDEDVFDAILIDMHMPIMNGNQASKEIRAKGIDTPIIALTADSKNDIEQYCDDDCSWYNDHLSKPIDKEKLYETIRHHLRAKQIAM